MGGWGGRHPASMGALAPGMGIFLFCPSLACEWFVGYTGWEGTKEAPRSGFHRAVSQSSFTKGFVCWDRGGRGGMLGGQGFVSASAPLPAHQCPLDTPTLQFLLMGFPALLQLPHLGLSWENCLSPQALSMPSSQPLNSQPASPVQACVRTHRALLPCSLLLPWLGTGLEHCSSHRDLLST